MAKSNVQRLRDTLDLLKEGVSFFVLREYKREYRAGKYLQMIEETLRDVTALPDEETAYQIIDTQGWLKLMSYKWDDVFRQKLGRAERSYVEELIDFRNMWGHEKAISYEDAVRAADTATRLLKSIGAVRQAEATGDIAKELHRLRYDAEEKRSTKKTTASLDEAPTTTQEGLKPWRLVVQPHPDVASGSYAQAEFAADLAQVVQGRADPEYGVPVEFFRRTYLTEGLIDLLVTGVKRLNGKGGDPVVQLQTSFGGGKTHSMLALYHLLGGDIGLSEIPGGEHITKRIGNIDDRIRASRAVIVGTAFDATNPRHYGDCITHTLWGDIAYQLGGVEAYQQVEAADLSGVSPGSDTILSVLEAHGPALIIIDELVAFARNLYGVTDRMAAGTFDSVMSFVQSLTEAVRRSSDSMLLVSIPESDIEIGGEGGKMALDILAKTIGRIESVWKPVSARESFEIVRRRLFSSEIDFAARDAVLSAFRSMYNDNRDEYPREVANSDYDASMKGAYPIHPELFARLYEDWSTLDRFQRTRGVLRFMATVIHRLWTDNDQSLMIMPASVPLFAADVRNELTRYLPENWPAIIDADIDGDESKPRQLDRENTTFGRYSASRRVARAIFIASAPSVAPQQVRGAEEVRVRLATVQPGEQVAVFNDALRRMSKQLTYLYTDGSRYWYDVRPTVNRMAQDRAQNIRADIVYQEAVARLKSVKFNRDDFSAVHIAPQSSADVADEWRARIIVLPPESAHTSRGDSSEAQKAAEDLLLNRGNAPRIYRNMVLFIAPDHNNAEAWNESLREYLAWKSIEDEAEILNLDAQQLRQVAESRRRTDETVMLRLQETYSWLIVPYQPSATGPIELQAHRISGQDNFYDRAARKLRQNEQLIYRWSPDILRIELDRLLWRDKDQVGIRQLWTWLASYCYLPRLLDEKVLLQSIEDGVQRADGPFGYAARVNDDGSYQGLIIGESVQPYMDEDEVIVRPDVVRERLDRVRKPDDNGHRAMAATPDAMARADTTATAPAAPRPRTRYHGTVTLTPERVNADVSQIVREVLQHLIDLPGTEIQITLEVSANRADGFDDPIMRTIRENGNTLRFDDHGFETG